MERITDRVWVVPTPMVGTSPRLRYTLTYLLVDDREEVHVVDPGWPGDEGWAILQHALEVLPARGGVASIVVTHQHGDHLGLAPRLRAATGAPLLMHENDAPSPSDRELRATPDLDEWGVPDARRAELLPFIHGERPSSEPVFPDAVFTGGRDSHSAPGLDLEVIHTPGHTAGSICVRLPADQLLLTGDHVLPAIYPGIGLGGAFEGNPLSAYLRSLQVISDFDDHEVLPGHHYRFQGLRDRADTIAAHHRRRSDEVREAMSAHPRASVHDVAAGLSWYGGWPRMQGPLLFSALLQTELHMRYVEGASAESAS